MPRGARITMDNAVYHIITRGNQKQTVFRDQLDYQEYLRLLMKYKKENKFKIYCFCLMPNHVHIIIEVHLKETLNKIMRGLNLSYTLYFNSKYKTVGHLWQDRFKSKIISKDAYLIECIKYIESNPIRANIVNALEDYPWGSFNFKNTSDSFLESEFSF